MKTRILGKVIEVGSGPNGPAIAIECLEQGRIGEVITIQGVHRVAVGEAGCLLYQNVSVTITIEKLEST